MKSEVLKVKRYMENKEMNFFDLCVACWRAMGRGCAACGRVLARMVRLTYRYWWLVLTLVGLAIGAALYYTRPENLKYRIYAVALLNGPSIQQFQQVYASLESGRLLPGDAAIVDYMREKKVSAFESFRVIDCLRDETPDYIDFKRRSAGTDTIKAQMHDRLCLQFRMKTDNMNCVEGVEAALLEYLNSNEVLQQAYATYLVNLREEVAFNHRQAQKLDSLTSCYYYQSAPIARPDLRTGNGYISFTADNKISLFLNEIYKQHAHLQRVDQRLQLATAPVTLENHFAAYPIPVNGRRKNVVLFFIFGWCFACLLAEAIDKRKQISAWLKK